MTFEKLKERINYEAQNNDFVTASKNIGSSPKVVLAPVMKVC